VEAIVFALPTILEDRQITLAIRPEHLERNCAAVHFPTLDLERAARAAQRSTVLLEGAVGPPRLAIEVTLATLARAKQWTADRASLSRSSQRA